MTRSKKKMAYSPATNASGQRQKKPAHQKTGSIPIRKLNLKKLIEKTILDTWLKKNSQVNTNLLYLMALKLITSYLYDEKYFIVSCPQLGVTSQGNTR